MELKGILFTAIVLLSENVLCSSNLVDRRCFDCFCQAQTNCDLSFQCMNKTITLCGPYKLSRPYWIDGGKLGNDDPNEEFENFVQCSKNKACAEQTIENYMKVYSAGKDCNSNGEVDCVDYFRIHLGGPGGCTQTHFENTVEWLRFLECYLNTATNIQEALISLSFKNFRV
ncbi:lysozyme-like [Centruroides vittatus]|uniref:lysozyme-like n=1 Tax=Centruroides vittatus TaxID=120091 RepID=UPI00350EEB57